MAGFYLVPMEIGCSVLHRWWHYRCHSAEIAFPSILLTIRHTEMFETEILLLNESCMLILSRVFCSLPLFPLTPRKTTMNFDLICTWNRYWTDATQQETNPSICSVVPDIRFYSKYVKNLNLWALESSVGRYWMRVAGSAYLLAIRMTVCCWRISLRHEVAQKLSPFVRSSPPFSRS